MRRANSDVALQGGGKRLKVDPDVMVDPDYGKELGKLESICLQNFMCHDNFKFTFGPRMNFVIGQNGSGKSAILTGLILALGGKSRVTGRFSNIKGYIKVGKRKAKVEVVLYNTGDLAYKPELYGDKICVTREFTIDGSNSYKLKSQAGKIVSSQKEELLNVLNAMDIQVENPIQIFTQETSKNFLMSKHATGENLYDIFFKGTGLHKLREHYQQAKNLKTEAFNELEIKKRAIPIMKEEMRKWKKFLASSEKVTDYKNELLWAGIIAMEKKLEEKENEHKSLVNKIKINKREIENCKNCIDGKTKELVEYTKLRSDCNVQISDLRSKLQKLNADRESCTLALRKFKGALDLHKKEEKKITHEIKDLEQRIKENKQKSQIDVEEDEKRRQEKIKQLQEHNKKIAFELNNLNKSRASKMEEQGQVNHHMDNLVAEMNSITWNLKKAEENVNRATMALQNKVNVFGGYTQNLLNEILIRKNEFKKLPIGPIGKYLEVKDSKWSPAIEKCIGRGLLCSYCVDNHQDDRLLKDIMRKHCRKLPSTIVCSYSDAVYDVSQYKAQTNLPTVLDMLKITDIQVANALIDQAKIENRILITDTNTGQNLMMSNPPKNCSGAYIMNRDQICLNPYRYYSEANPNNGTILSSVQQCDINQLTGEMNKLKAQHRVKEQEKVQKQKYSDAIPREVKRLTNEMVHLSSMQKDNQEKLKDLECVKETEDVYCLEEALQALKLDYESKQIEIESCQDEVINYSSKLGNIAGDVDEHIKLLGDEKEKFGELGALIHDRSQEEELLTTGKNRFEKEAKDCEKQLQSVQKELEDYKVKTKDATRTALALCPRIDTKRHYDEIQRQLAETSKVIEEQSHCDRNELLKNYIEKQKVIKEAEAELKRIENYITRLDGMLKVRFKKFREITNCTKKIVNMTFMNILDGNGYTGCCNFDVATGTLKLEVSPKAGQSARKNHSILSGGERSYVTLSFLLALWERTEMPFRVLDEYDVFMDSNNRQLSVDLLIQKAKQLVSTQFIFLSPLDLPVVEWPKEYVKIHKMIPPKRSDDAGPSSTT